MTTDIEHRANKKQIGAAGEHYVTAEISRRGGYATPFAGNMPGIDIVAFDTGVAALTRTKSGNREPGCTTRLGQLAPSCRSAGH